MFFFSEIAPDYRLGHAASGSDLFLAAFRRTPTASAEGALARVRGRRREKGSRRDASLGTHGRDGSAAARPSAVAGAKKKTGASRAPPARRAADSIRARSFVGGGGGASSPESGARASGRPIAQLTGSRRFGQLRGAFETAF